MPTAATAKERAERARQGEIARDQGKLAFERGDSVTACPHGRTGPLAAAWVNGWFSARQKRHELMRQADASLASCRHDF